ncbi:ricin-type beta-trefoil lectin domain-like domain-containing protein [Hirsutella rhossiliensis]|uniref:Ricin-type beta-trefoil lectin domain-like domain-containing protein n=1 Tax=Hirsutella rhossiliensis TaxID=111463 RepID=A0A9P8SM34_9HYPO|nr:ricin-type beta-trefoil lectin domain-like domain-containing protein [Hirsutella rhossiliensis]KAH0966425.1 ricin-type beta-trefoil lectin domain-like domain-containing protein [Hirsutella rhossiliensis]
MSDYTGPGVYEFYPANALGRRMSVWGGGATVGTAVKLYAAGKTENLAWEIVAAGGDKGDPEVGDRQYHIVGVQSGLMLCAAENGSDSECTISTRPVRHGSCRWKMIPAKNGYYYFASVLNPDKWLAVRGGQDADGAPLMTWAKTEVSHFQFKLKKPDY